MVSIGTGTVWRGGVKMDNLEMMHEYASNMLPFILVKDKKNKRGFYSETGDNAINQLINFLKNGNKI